MKNSCGNFVTWARRERLSQRARTSGEYPRSLEALITRMPRNFGGWYKKKTTQSQRDKDRDKSFLWRSMQQHNKSDHILHNKIIVRCRETDNSSANFSNENIPSLTVINFLVIKFCIFSNEVDSNSLQLVYIYIYKIVPINYKISLKSCLDYSCLFVVDMFRLSQ